MGAQIVTFVLRFNYSINTSWCDANGYQGGIPRAFKTFVMDTSPDFMQTSIDVDGLTNEIVVPESFLARDLPNIETFNVAFWGESELRCTLLAPLAPALPHLGPLPLWSSRRPLHAFHPNTLVPPQASQERVCAAE